MKKTDKKDKKYPVKRIPERYLLKLKKIGDGNWRHGLDKVLDTYEIVIRDPRIILRKELENFGNIIKTFADENHYQHYIDSGMPVLLRGFVETGNVKPTVLFRKRQEKPIDEFQKKEEGDKDAA